MPVGKMIRCVLSHLPFYYPGGRQMHARGKVTSGPINLIGKEVEVRITFEEVEQLYMRYQSAKESVEKYDAKLAKMKAENCPDDDS